MRALLLSLLVGLAGSLCAHRAPVVAHGHHADHSPAYSPAAHSTTPILPQAAQPTPAYIHTPVPTVVAHPLEDSTLYAKYPRARAFKSRIVAIALCAALGFTGIHRYYLGATKAWISPGYLALNVVMWFIDLTVLSVDGMDRFLFTNRFFAGVDH